MTIFFLTFTETGFIFAASSNLIESQTEVILVDAQFPANDARTVVDRINATGKQLTTIFVFIKAQSDATTSGSLIATMKQ